MVESVDRQRNGNLVGRVDMHSIGLHYFRKWLIAPKSTVRFSATEAEIKATNTTPRTHVAHCVHGKIALSERPLVGAIACTLVVLAAIVYPNIIRDADGALLVSPKYMGDHFTVVSRPGRAGIATELAFYQG